MTEESKICKEYPEIYFDFNAVAKGYGIDLIGDYLVSNKIQNFLIELGGELLAKGVNLKKNKTWIVGIENSFSTINDRSYSTSIMLKDIGMATSCWHQRRLCQSNLLCQIWGMVRMPHDWSLEKYIP